MIHNGASSKTFSVVEYLGIHLSNSLRLPMASGSPVLMSTPTLANPIIIASKTRTSLRRIGIVNLRSWRTRSISIQAVLDSGSPRRRLVDIIRLVPEVSRNYFRSPSRRALFGGISLLSGFYVAQTISLSFGALGVNDVIASVICVILTEYATRFYYSRPKVTFAVALLNNFKMGFTYGLFIDAFKLAS